MVVGGYSIICEKDNLKISYCHVSPNFIVSVGQKIQAGEIIGQVGPKYIENIVGNPYKDSSGKQTNGATTGSHLHLSIKENNVSIDPLMYLN